MTEHTPGPWKVSEGPRITGADGTVVVFTVDGSYGTNIEANARVIAVAPELLAVLKEAHNVAQQHNLLSTATDLERLQTLKRFLDWWNYSALPAIAKAEGKED